MQEKNATFLDFLRRTDSLAVSKGLNVGDLIPILGLSRATLFSYRSGKRPISAKAWMKLEAAEKAEGIAHVRADMLKEKAPELALSTHDEGSNNQFQVELLSHLAALTTAITEQNKRIDAILEQRATSSSGRGQEVKTKAKKLA